MKRRQECGICRALVRRGTGAMALMLTEKRKPVRRRVCGDCARECCMLVAFDVCSRQKVRTRITVGPERREEKQRTLEQWFGSDGAGDGA